MPQRKKLKPDQYEIIKEGSEDIMRINCIGTSYSPSISEDTNCMERVIEKLSKEPTTKRIILSSTRNYNYNYAQTARLLEIANLYNLLTKQRIFSVENLGIGIEDEAEYTRRYNLIQTIIQKIKYDVLSTYVELKRTIRAEKINQKDLGERESQSKEVYLKLLDYILQLLENLTIIKETEKYLEGFELGDRSLYKQILRPSITPNFMYTRLMSSQPINADQLDIYRIDDKTDVTMLTTPDEIKTVYHLNPPEFKLTEDKYSLLELARSVISEHQPKDEEFLQPDKMRRTFKNISKDLLTELAQQKKIDLTISEIEEMADILVRYTVGFGLIEILLKDPKVQDIVINAPIGETPIYIVHQDYEECVTNIYPSVEDGLSWATKLRLISGRPLDEANPVLDTELNLEYARARVAVINTPLNPYGLAFALRRHRDKPWTLPLFMKVKMIDALAAGLISFLIDGARTMMVAGTRSSGKTSMLGSYLVEIMRKYRVITIEDTLELPTEYMRKVGYNIQPMRARSALAKGTNELGADEGIRTSLRLGDSSLIVGEIRSTEALALYEAMRVGALANVVAGTIHGANPYGVYDRVVNDLKVPKTSFKATDIIVVCNPIKSPDGLKKWKRVTQITEVRKHWENDPIGEGGFVDLMKYNPKTDKLEPTDDLINGDSEILKDIAGNIKEWAGNWEEVWDNILLRANTKQALLDLSIQNDMPELLEADFVVQSNDAFHKIIEKVKDEEKKLDNKKILTEYVSWLKREINKRRS